MRRTQIYLEEDLDSQLRAVAATEGRSAAAVIREAVRRYLTANAQVDDPIAASIGSVRGLPEDAADAHDRDLYGAHRVPARRR